MTTLERKAKPAEIKVTYRKKSNSFDLIKVTQSSEIEELLRNVWSNQIEYKEEMILFCLNRQNEVLGYSKVSSGGSSGTVIDNKIILQIALNTHSSGIIVAHNHTSGNLKPSQSDIEVTRRLRSACELIDIKLLDHIILSKESYLSMTDHGLI